MAVTTTAWSQLPNDVWSLIGNKLDVETDRCCFRLVSKSFNSSLPAFPQPPWLLLSESQFQQQQPLLSSSSSEEKEEVKIVNEENHQQLSPPPPPLRGIVGIGGYGEHKDLVYEIELPEAHQMRCTGSTGNWLITVDKTDGIHLLNPFSRVQIDLPLQSTFKYGFDPDEDDFHVTPEQHRDNLLRKVIISSTSSLSNSNNKDCIIMAIHHYLKKLAIARPGDTSWTTVDTPYHFFEDVIFYKEQFYGVNHYGMVMVCDISDLHNPKATVVMENWLNQNFYQIKYLVEWMGELLLVIKFVLKFFCWDNRQECIEQKRTLYKTEKFEVYKLDFTIKKWEEVTSLGDYCLFLGSNSSVSVSAINYFGSLKKNCIYFTDDHTFGYRATKTPGGHDMGVFDLKDKSIQPYYKGVSTCYYSPPIWIIPNPTAMNTKKESDSLERKVDNNL
ncbi:hypothetical protein FRX31_015230 [Thalictrum thalictroides]|uniref:KIB1-4 beta-propeller domain-containing protein n=1 Tax=Thalictrum thalictroides TaxID=46969 RepID=A0A7J6WCW5_THATH|nr:hypothetical protein FRX31_015230 [Thalictrum thalictroides]